MSKREPPPHRARKRFGQHFLHDRSVLDRIVAAIDPQPDDRVIEIGPGLGALTIPLLARVRRMEAIELDRDVIPRLAENAGAHGELLIHAADVLTFDFRALAGSGAKLRICGNLPYNISTPLLFHLLDAQDAILDMHFMLQKEVVARMAAAPGSKAYGRLTVMLAVHCRSEHLFTVGPGSFRPPPQVDSAVVRVVPHTAPPFTVADPARFAAVVAAAFGQRRKTLRNSVAGLVSPAGFAAAGIDPSRRAETLSPAEFAALAATLPPL